jgi:hypothetical protein
MRSKAFGDFVDKKKRESIRQLGLVKQILEKTGMKVDNFLETDNSSDPYIFCHNPTKSGSFDGIRVYKIGTDLAFRIQKESKTHPYGTAYPLPIESMFSDFLTDEGIDESKAGKKIIEAVNKEIRRFFDKSLEAEKYHRNKHIEQEREGSKELGTRTTGDYSSLSYNKV